MKIVKFFLLVFFILFILNPCYAAQNETLKNVEASFKTALQDDYRNRSVEKYYKPYEINITNKNKQPVLLSANTELEFILRDGSVLKSESRRDMYRKSRKRDVGRYWWVAMPGALIAGGITGITFFIGAPIGALIYIGAGAVPDKAVRTNVKISQELYNKHKMPIRLEPETTYNVRMLVPKKISPAEVVITNATFDMKEMYDIKIPAEAL